MIASSVLYSTRVEDKYFTCSNPILRPRPTRLNYFYNLVVFPSLLQPQLQNAVLLEILQLSSSCSKPICPHETCNKVCVSVFGGVAKRFRKKHTSSVACVSENQYWVGLSRAGSHSCIITCFNERENTPNWLHLSHISHNKRAFVSSYTSIPVFSSRP